MAAYRRIEGFVTRAAELTGDTQDPPAGRDAMPPAFAAALDDNLAVPLALAVVHDTIHDGNNALASGDTAALGASLAQVRAMLGVLGLDPLSEQWRAPRADDDLRGVVDALATVGDRRAAGGQGPQGLPGGGRDQGPVVRRRCPPRGHPRRHPMDDQAMIPPWSTAASCRAAR